MRKEMLLTVVAFVVESCREEGMKTSWLSRSLTKEQPAILKYWSCIAEVKLENMTGKIEQRNLWN
jgi:hypothetical protein